MRNNVMHGVMQCDTVMSGYQDSNASHMEWKSQPHPLGDY